MEKKKVAIYIGRFQPMHNGHVEVIKHCKANYDETLVLIGSCNKRRSIKNPFSIDMVINWLSALNVDKIGKLSDYIYDDALWANQVKSIVKGLYSKDEYEFTLVGHDKDASSFYLDMFPEYKLDLLPAFHDGISATDIRKQLLDNGWCKLSTLPSFVVADLVRFVTTQEYTDLHEEYVYFMKEQEKFKDYPYKDTLKFNCADAVVYCNGHVLLIQRKKAPGKGAWALPGGFVNTNETYLQAAKRELLEETGVDISALDKEFYSVNSMEYEIFDHPSRGCGIPRITVGYFFNISATTGIFPKVTASDDAIGACWVTLKELKNMVLHDDHMDIINAFIKVHPNY